MNKKIVPSEQTQQEALAVARAIQKPGQTKEQTKLIAQGIEKGIALTKQTSAETQESEEFNEFDATTSTKNPLAIKWSPV